jgi:hypothetical protein
MKSPTELLLTVAGIGGRLGIAGDKLRMVLPSDSSPELKEAIRYHKQSLLNLMRLRSWSATLPRLTLRSFLCRKKE